MNLGVSTFMRAPGEASGTAVLEIAMDELAEKLKMDPVQLRLVNYAEKDPGHDRPWTNKHLRECYQQAAERFGWSKRSATPRTLEDGNSWIGSRHGHSHISGQSKRCSSCCSPFTWRKTVRRFWNSDLGTGTYTIMAQQAAAGLGIDPTKVEVKLGDSTLPKAPVSGGSQSAASVLPAIEDATTQLKLKLVDLASTDADSPLHGLKALNIDVKDGKLINRNNSSQSETLISLIARNGNKPVEALGSAEPSESKDSMTAYSWGAVFAEVAVDKDTHMVKVRRVVGTYDIGTLLNQKTGLNQLIGGIVWGVSFALYEDAHLDPKYGRVVNESLAEYHVPVNADIGTIDVTVLNIPDLKFNPIGSRGIGEIGITGVSAAVANAIYNATGKRIREYPITPDKIMLA